MASAYDGDCAEASSGEDEIAILEGVAEQWHIVGEINRASKGRR